MKEGLAFDGLLRCDQPGCDFAMKFRARYDGHIVDKVAVRIDRLYYHRREAHPEVVAAEDAEQPGADS